MKDLRLSIFRGYADTCPADTSLANIVEMIRCHADIAAHTEKHRYNLQQGWKLEAAREKSSCPCFAVSVRFDKGKHKSDIRNWTHLCLADFDHIPAEQMGECLKRIREDQHTLLAYTTISGNGIRIISPYVPLEKTGLRTESELHAHAFSQMNQYYATLIGHKYDEKCKNATRLSGLAHDPDAWFNPAAIPFEPKADKLREKTKQSERRLKRVIAAIEHQLEKEGLKYTEHHRNEYIMRTGYLLNAYGINQQIAIEWALRQFTDYDGDVAGIFHSCYRQVAEFGTKRLSANPLSPSHADESVITDIETFLNTQGRFRKNTVTGKCEMAETGSETYKDLTDRMVNTLWSRMCKEVRPIRIQDLRAILESEFVELYNPFTKYLESLPVWDRQSDPIGALAAQVHVSTGAELFPLFFKKWLVAMIASLLDENVVNHEILVLIGRQGIYKTTWLNNLLPPALRRYFYLKGNSRHISKDDLLTLSEFAIVCLEELDEMEGREVNQLKALTTMRHVNERAAYAHYKENRPHIASLCGTGNNLHFLTDLTGNRRWMPFEVESIDNPYEHPLDYQAIYAQAYALLKDGFPYWLEQEEINKLNVHNKYFEVPCLERELIQTYYQRPLPGQESVFLTNAQIMMRIGGGIHQKLSAVKIGLAMKQEGYQAIRSGGKRGYLVIELTAEQLELRKKAMARYSHEEARR